VGHSPIELWARPGVRVRDVIIHLTPAIDYTGVVVSPGGEPVAGAEVRVIDLPGGEQEIVTIRDRFRSGRRGELVSHAPDFALLEATADGYGPGRARLDGSAQGTHRLVIRLTSAEDGGALGSARIDGVVVDAAGLPLPRRRGPRRADAAERRRGGALARARARRARAGSPGRGPRRHRRRRTLLP